jgi:hypothetical protein
MYSQYDDIHYTVYIHCQLCCSKQQSYHVHTSDNSLNHYKLAVTLLQVHAALVVLVHDEPRQLIMHAEYSASLIKLLEVILILVYYTSCRCTVHDYFEYQS